MSRKYRETYGDVIVPREEMRRFLQTELQVDVDGKPVYLTEQSHKKECDVNHIIRKYDKTGLITHVNQFEAEFGDVSGADFKTMVDEVTAIRQKFMELPSRIRQRFGGDPAQYLTFMEDGNNREEAIKLGLIRNDVTVQTDGLGEFVKAGEQVTAEPSV